MSNTLAPYYVPCAGCGGDTCTHHHLVEVFNRDGEDSDTGTHVHIGDALLGVGENVATSAGNPSARRNGVRIWMWCECCDVHTVIELAQHKGITILNTRRVESCPVRTPRDGLPARY
jgi:hypothetical protein